LLPDRLQTGDTLFQALVQISHAGLDGIVEPIEALVSFGDVLMKPGQMFAAALGALLTTVQNAGEDGFQPLGL
jgi:hypothetical protein